MEIPYVVTPRKDTGLNNSKIAIWLFLASEVMLFGGFFSAYVFLRVDADYPWPERALPVIPGLVNTFVLIASSVTVVFAWASLKLRKWRHFQAYMGFTILCALIFMVLKGIEYNVKFHHQALRMSDGAIIEGHLGYELKADADKHHPKAEDYVLDHKGHKKEENLISIEATQVTFNTVRFHKDWVEEIIDESKTHGSKIALAEDLMMKTEVGQKEPIAFLPKGTELSIEVLEKISGQHLEARKNNANLRTDDLREAWKKAKKDYPGKRDWEIVDKVAVNPEHFADKTLTEMPSVTFTLDHPTKLEFSPRDVKEGATQSSLRDETKIEGKLLESPMVFHYVDALDFRTLAMKAKGKGLDPMAEVEKSWIINNSPAIKEAWEWHKSEITKLEAELKKNSREPTFTERYRIEWRDFVAKAENKPRTERDGVVLPKEQIFGPDYDERAKIHAFPEHIEVPRDQVAFSSKFAPAWNTYYAIYFTMTGLHGLHVIGGALVLAYYLFFGKKMYLSNPEWLANRVEIGGLFWHFVDLVWIFLFPLLYLM
jgi:heme/copper-type cytochrome/quinol oxidase subunit 3